MRLRAFFFLDLFAACALLAAPAAFAATVNQLTSANQLSASDGPFIPNDAVGTVYRGPSVCFTTTLRQFKFHWHQGVQGFRGIGALASVIECDYNRIAGRFCRDDLRRRVWIAFATFFHVRMLGATSERCLLPTRHSTSSV